MVKVLMGWLDFLEKQNIKTPEFEEWPDDVNDFLENLADLPKGQCYERTPEYGERAWRIPGRKYCIIVWDEGNQWFDPIGVEIEVGSFTFITREETEVKECHLKSS